MRHADLLARGAQADVASPVQPLGTGLERPAAPAGPLVEAADEHEEIVSRGVDAPGKVHNGAVELVYRGISARPVCRDRVGAWVDVGDDRWPLRGLLTVWYYIQSLPA